MTEATGPILAQTCPYCGSEDIKVNSQWERVGTFHCGCNEVNCAMDGPMRHDADEAIAAWNRLTVVKPAEKEKPKVDPITDTEMERCFKQSPNELNGEDWSDAFVQSLRARIEADRETSKDNHRRMEKLSDEASRWENECERLRAQNAEQADEIKRLQGCPMIQCPFEAKVAEQAQEIADLRGCVYARQEEIARLKIDRPSWTASCAGAGERLHQRVWYDEPGCPVCAGAIFSDRRKGERRTNYARPNCKHRHALDRTGTDRRKAK